MKKHGRLAAGLGCAVLISALLTGCSAPVPGNSGTENGGKTTNSAAEDWSKTLKLTSKSFTISNAECDYSDGTAEVLVKFKNISGRDIAAYEADGELSDVFGNSLMKVNLSESKKLVAGATSSAGSWGNSCYRISSYGDEAKLLDMDKENIVLDVKVTKIAFTDGEIIEF